MRHQGGQRSYCRREHIENQRAKHESRTKAREPLYAVFVKAVAALHRQRYDKARYQKKQLHAEVAKTKQENV